MDEIAYDKRYNNNQKKEKDYVNKNKNCKKIVVNN